MLGGPNLSHNSSRFWRKDADRQRVWRRQDGPWQKQSVQNPLLKTSQIPVYDFLSSRQFRSTRPSAPSFRALIWGVVIVGCFYVGVALPVKYSAGQATSVTFVVKALLDMKVHIWLPYLVAIGLAGLWKRERSLRKRTIRREHKRVEAFEKKIHPNRTSSGFEE